MNIPKDEVLRYLGYSGQPITTQVDELINECISELESLARPQHIYKIYPIEKQGALIKVIGTTLEFESIDLSNLWIHSQMCAIMAATLGALVDQKISLYQKINMTKATILNACAAAAIEEVCDGISQEIETTAQTQNLHSTMRYSPGYGDLSISLQHNILSLLEAPKKIGLTCTDTSILLPAKSVTAFVGLSNKKTTASKPSCQACNKYSTCQYRKDGISCGYS